MKSFQTIWICLTFLLQTATSNAIFSVRPSSYLDIATTKKVGVQLANNFESLMTLNYENFVNTINGKKLGESSHQSFRRVTLKQSLANKLKIDPSRQLGIDDDPDFCLEYMDPESTLGDYSDVELVTATEALDQLKSLRGGNPDFYRDTLRAFFIDDCEKKKAGEIHRSRRGWKKLCYQSTI
jgi:hypothetical protein